MQSNRDRAVAVFKVLVFFIAIKLLGAFKDIGSGMGESMMVELASRPVLGLLLGILVTSVIQSSSTTTSLVVGLAASGVFGNTPEEAMGAAVPLIMGANIGTTITNTIVSFGHIGDDDEFRRAFSAATVHDIFNFITVLLLFPLQVTTNFLGAMSVWLSDLLVEVGGLTLVNPLHYVVNPQVDAVEALFEVTAVGDFVIILALVIGTMAALGYLEKRQRLEKRGKGPVAGVVLAITGVALAVKTYHAFIFSKPLAIFVAGLGLLLLALWAMVSIMRKVVLVRAQRLFRSYVFTSATRALLVGLVLTTLVQSSSVTTSLIVPLAGAGMVTLEQVFPYALGANLGTTVTALLAALSLGEPIGLAVALAHLLFNGIGIALIFPLKAIRRLPLWLATNLANGAVRWKLLPVAYVLGLYLVLPIVLIWLGGEVD